MKTAFFLQSRGCECILQVLTRLSNPKSCSLQGTFAQAAQLGASIIKPIVNSGNAGCFKNHRKL